MFFLNYHILNLNSIDLSVVDTLFYFLIVALRKNILNSYPSMDYLSYSLIDGIKEVFKYGIIIKLSDFLQKKKTPIKVFKHVE